MGPRVAFEHDFRDSEQSVQILPVKTQSSKVRKEREVVAGGSWASVKSCESVMSKAVAICTNVSTCGMRCARSIIERYEAAVTHYHLDLVRTRFRPFPPVPAVSDSVPRPRSTHMEAGGNQPQSVSPRS
jgi:hypothetical protein